jgi:hypothetical protein
MDVAAAIQGGHGELFVQQFDPALNMTSGLINAPLAAAAASITAELVVGSGAAALVEARGHGGAIDLFPSASNALKLPAEFRNLPPTPLYARAPDAKVRNAA